MSEKNKKGLKVNDLSTHSWETRKKKSKLNPIKGEEIIKIKESNALENIKTLEKFDVSKFGYLKINKTVSTFS